MKFYRVHFRREDDESEGYTFYTSKRAAEQGAREGVEGQSEITVLNIEPTKHGILRALNKYGGHPDNG